MIILTIIGLIGITIIIISTPILKTLRSKIKSNIIQNIITCAMCIGFIVGFCFGIKDSLINAFILGGVISVFSYIIDLLITIMEIFIFIKSGNKPKRDATWVVVEEDLVKK